MSGPYYNYVTIHHETSVKSPLMGHFQFMLYLEGTCPNSFKCQLLGAQELYQTNSHFYATFPF